jgi:hypothetical protein
MGPELSTLSDMPMLARLVPNHVRAYQRVDIAGGLRQLCAASERYWNSMSAEEFARPLGAAWSPADNVRHLTKTVRSVARALRLPRFLLRLLFGRSRRLSRSYDTIVAEYHHRLRCGGRAGRYAPRVATVGADFEAYRRQVLTDHHAAIEQLANLVLNWRRTHVDTLRLPHPLLGKLTVREMLLFVLYHNLHHVQVVARRRGEWFSDDTPLAG